MRTRPVRTIRQAVQACSRYQPIHPCTACRDTPNRPATSITGTPACTSSTARYRCSVMVNSISTRRSVTHQVKPPRNASAEYDSVTVEHTRSTNTQDRLGEDFLNCFKARPRDRRLAASLPASTPAAQTESTAEHDEARPSPEQEEAGLPGTRCAT
jgi:hypothetical protein